MKLDNVYVTYGVVSFFGQLVGFTKEFDQEFHRRVKELGETILEELGLSLEQAVNLDLNTKLGPKATKKYKELKAWLATQHKGLARV